MILKDHKYLIQWNLDYPSGTGLKLLINNQLND